MDSKSHLRFVTFLTFVRFPLVLLFFAGAVINTEHGWGWLFYATFALLIAAATTDLFDGYFARKLRVMTTFGAHADPLMDKLFYLLTLPLLVFVAVKDGNIRHAMVLLILTLFFLARDQWVTFLRSIGSLYNISGSANWSGKLRTIVNFPLICAIYHFEASPLPLLPPELLYAFEAVAFVINIISLWIYTRHYWPYVRRSAELRSVARTETRESDAALSAHSLVQSHKTLSLVTMASGMAHDFNNLIAAVLGNASILVRGLPPDSPILNNARQIELTALRALDLTRQMALYSGRGQLTAQPIDVASLIRDMSRQLEGAVTGDVQLAYAIDDPLPSIQGDPDQIRQVISNLVANASDAMTDRSGTITVGARIMPNTPRFFEGLYFGQRPKGDLWVCIRVADAGCGMGPEILSRVFDPFFTTKIRGQGLGLAVAIGIMRTHGGGIKVESHPDKGSTFTVLFPVSPEKVDSR